MMVNGSCHFEIDIKIELFKMSFFSSKKTTSNASPKCADNFRGKLELSEDLTIAPL